MSPVLTKKPVFIEGVELAARRGSVQGECPLECTLVLRHGVKGLLPFAERSLYGEVLFWRIVRGRRSGGRLCWRATCQGIAGWNSSRPMSTGSGPDACSQWNKTFIGSIDSPCLRKLMPVVSSQLGRAAGGARTPVADDNRAPSAGARGCRFSPETRQSKPVHLPGCDIPCDRLPRISKF